MKRFLWAFVIIVLLGTAACQKKEKGPELGEKSKFTAEDYQEKNRNLISTDKGIYYYNQEQKALRYYDFASEKDIYLCNKPECKHDGNAFCVATNARYSHEIHILYNGKIVAPAVEETDTQNLMKLLVFSLDGAQMEDYATMLTIEKTEGVKGVKFIEAQLHRNKLLASFQLSGDKDLADVVYSGTFFYDLDTGETTSLNEELFAKDNPEYQEIKAQGDYFYCYRQVNRKRKELYRYHIVNKTEEECTPEASFQGEYFFLDDDTILYQRKYYTEPKDFGIYHISTGELEVKEWNNEFFYGTEKEWDQEWHDEWMKEYCRITGKDSVIQGDEDYESFIAANAIGISEGMGCDPMFEWISVDEEYIYHCYNRWVMEYKSVEGIRKRYLFCVEIYDHSGNYVKSVNLADAFDRESVLKAGCFSWIHWYCYDNEIRFSVRYRLNGGMNTEFFRMNRQEFLDGTGKAEFLFEVYTK